MENSRRDWAIIASTTLAAALSQPMHIGWDLARPDPKPKKATKDRSKIKAARKQNRSRK